MIARAARSCPGNLIIDKPVGLYSVSVQQYYDFSVLNLEFQYLMIDRATLERGDGQLVRLFTVVDLAGVGMRVFSWNVSRARPPIRAGPAPTPTPPHTTTSTPTATPAPTATTTF